jgi:hypothetical protein
MSWTVAQTLLALWWLLGSILTAAALLYSVIVEKVWGPKTTDAWNWLLPLIIPTLTLTLSTAVTDVPTPKSEKTRVSFRAFLFTMIASLLYFGAIIFAIRLAGISQISPIDDLRSSSVWLAAFQGVVGTMIGILYGRRSPSAS